MHANIQAKSLQSMWRTALERRWLLVSAAAAVYGLVETGSLAVVHHTGAEVYGILVAAIAAGAGVLNVVLLRAPRVRRIATGAVVAIWVVVALGGIAGFIAHVIGPVAGHGPIDPRPRPIAAPLAFTLLGSVGAAALVLGQRARARAATATEKE
jgi:hypothetical protein